MESRRLTPAGQRRLVAGYRRSRRCLILLDYDGTLVGFTGDPAAAAPDAELLQLLKALQLDPRNLLAIISGRDRETLQRWFGGLGVSLAAEHGAWIRDARGDWNLTTPQSTGWQAEVGRILERMAARTPGAMVEQKAFSLAWHYRQAEPKLAAARARELKAALRPLTAPGQLEILSGNKVIEIRDHHSHKGRPVEHWLSQGPWEFILAAGDDTTDEDMFRALPAPAFSIKVGGGPSAARLSVNGPLEVRQLLAALTAACE